MKSSGISSGFRGNSGKVKIDCDWAIKKAKENKLNLQDLETIKKESSINNTCKDSGKTVLHYLCDKNDSTSEELVIAILNFYESPEISKGYADLSLVDHTGKTAFSYLSKGSKAYQLFFQKMCHQFRIFASAGNVQAVVRYILNNEVDLNSSGKSGNTALHYACKQGDWNVIVNLVNAGAILDLPNQNGELPADVAQTTEMKKTLSNLTTAVNSFKQISKIFSDLKIEVNERKYSEEFQNLRSSVNENILFQNEYIPIHKLIQNVYDDKIFSREGNDAKVFEQLLLYVVSLGRINKLLDFTQSKSFILMACEFMARLLGAVLTFKNSLGVPVEVLSFCKKDKRSEGHALVVVNQDNLDDLSQRSDVKNKQTLVFDLFFNRVFFLSGDKNIIKKRYGQLPSILDTSFFERSEMGRSFSNQFLELVDRWISQVNYQGSTVVRDTISQYKELKSNVEDKVGRLAEIFSGKTCLTDMQLNWK